MFSKSAGIGIVILFSWSFCHPVPSVALCYVICTQSLNDVSPYFYVLLSLEAAPTVQLDFDKFRKGPALIINTFLYNTPPRGVGTSWPARQRSSNMIAPNYRMIFHFLLEIGLLHIRFTGRCFLINYYQPRFKKFQMKSDWI